MQLQIPPSAHQESGLLSSNLFPVQLLLDSTCLDLDLIYPLFIYGGAIRVEAACLKYLSLLRVLSMRDSATSAMRGWEQQTPDGSTSRLILSSAVFTRKMIKSTLRFRGSHFVYEKAVQNKPQNKINRFDSQELIARLEDNRISTWSTNRGEETGPQSQGYLRTTDVTQSFCREHEEKDI
jgi:hypothetical protein